jgi:hypothetical protein
VSHAIRILTRRGRYMCREAGVILGITKELAEDARSGKHVLECVAGRALGSPPPCAWLVCRVALRAPLIHLLALPVAAMLIWLSTICLW